MHKDLAMHFPSLIIKLGKCILNEVIWPNIGWDKTGQRFGYNLCPIVPASGFGWPTHVLSSSCPSQILRYPSDSLRRLSPINDRAHESHNDEAHRDKSQRWGSQHNTGTYVEEGLSSFKSPEIKILWYICILDICAVVVSRDILTSDFMNIRPWLSQEPRDKNILWYLSVPSSSRDVCVWGSFDLRLHEH